MDVKFEGENVVRHLDLTTHNHMSQTGQTPPWPHIDSMALEPGGACHKENEQIKKACDPEKEWKKNCPTPPKHPGPLPKNKAKRKEWKASFKKYLSEFPTFAEKCKENPCMNARKCMLVPYKPDGGCCPGQTGDHIIDAASFLGPKEYKGQPRNQRPRIDGWQNYDVDAAPCVCAEGPNQTTATHGQLHTRRSVAVMHFRDSKGQWPRKKAAEVGGKAICKTFPDSGCSQKCMEAQINHYHDKACTSDPEKPINASSSMTKNEEARNAARVDMGVPIPQGNNARP
jgi:hypothetical protein